MSTILWCAEANKLILKKKDFHFKKSSNKLIWITIKHLLVVIRCKSEHYNLFIFELTFLKVFFFFSSESQADIQNVFVFTNSDQTIKFLEVSQLKPKFEFHKSVFYFIFTKDFKKHSLNSSIFWKEILIIASF